MGRKCCHFCGIVQTSFCVASLRPYNVVEHWHEYDPIFKGFWSLPVHVPLKMLSDVKSGSTWEYVPNELHFSGCQIHFSTNPYS